MADFPFDNSSSQAERRKVLENDRKASSYFHHAQNADLEMGGRFSKVTPTTVTGTTPRPVYPQQPETSPSNQLALMPDEPLMDGRGEGDKLGYKIDDMGGSASVDVAMPEARPITKFVRRA